MSFYHIVRDFSLEKGWVLGDLLVGGEPALSQEDLKKHPQLSCSITYPGPAHPFTFAHPNFPVISSDLADLLDIPGQTELLPVRIVRPSSRSTREYFALSITNQVDAIDREQSRFEVWTPKTHSSAHKHGTYRSFEKLVIDENKVQGLSIFKLEGYRVLTVITSALKTRLTERSIPGVVFRPLLEG